MLLNLKRIYVRMRSFPQARTLTELLLALDPSALTELRDRGLLAYHLNDFSMALRDLEAYLRFTSRGEPGPGSESETEDEEDCGAVWQACTEPGTGAERRLSPRAARSAGPPGRPTPSTTRGSCARAGSR